MKFEGPHVAPVKAGCGPKREDLTKEATETGHPFALKALTARAPVRRVSARMRRGKEDCIAVCVTYDRTARDIFLFDVRPSLAGAEVSAANDRTARAMRTDFTPCRSG